MFSAISKVDSKGRISIPIGFRAKLKLVEGSKVKIVFNKNRLIISPNSDVKCFTYGQGSVKVCTRVCESLSSGSSTDSGPKKR